MRTTFINCLIEQARKDERIFLITPDMGFSVLEGYREEFSDRFLNTGIAEQNAIGVASGLALSGKMVFVYSIIPFITMRCYEQIRIDVAYMNTNVRIVGVGAGFSYGPAGASHHAIEDIAIMRALPNMTVCCPGDPVETRELITRSFDHNGPIYFRLAKNGEPRIHHQDTRIEIGKAVMLQKGSDIAIIATSNMVEVAHAQAQKWSRQGKTATLLSMPTLKPMDRAAVESIIYSGMPIVTMEEHNVIGGLGSAVAEIVAESGRGVKFTRIAIQDQYCHYVGSQSFLRNKFKLDDIDFNTVSY